MNSNPRREPTVRAAVGRPSGWREGSSYPFGCRLVGSPAIFFFLLVSPRPHFTLHFRRQPARTAASRLKLWLLAAANTPKHACWPKRSAFNAAPPFFLELHLFPCERCSRLTTTQLLASGQWLERGRVMAFYGRQGSTQSTSTPARRRVGYYY